MLKPSYHGTPHSCHQIKCDGKDLYPVYTADCQWAARFASWFGETKHFVNYCTVQRYTIFPINLYSRAPEKAREPIAVWWTCKNGWMHAQNQHFGITYKQCNPCHSCCHLLPLFEKKKNSAPVFSFFLVVVSCSEQTKVMQAKLHKSKHWKAR